MSEHDQEIRIADPSEGFDRGEPKAGSIAAFAIGSIVLLILTIGALQQYFEHAWNQAVYEKVLAPPSEQLKDLRNRDDWNLTHYMYMDKKSGVVRIPVDRAMELIVKDAAAGKTFYPAKATVPKKEEPALPAAGTALAGPGAPAAPGAVEKK